MDQELITLQRAGPIAVIRLNNPPLNLQTLALIGRLEQIVLELEVDETVRVAILTGSGGGVFCAGSDIKEFPALKDNFIEAKIRRENAVFDRLERLSKPTVSAIDGKALGGGCEVTLCCDFRVLDQSAAMGFPEVFLGGFPGSGGIARLSRLVGVSRAAELMSTGEILPAPQALALGLVNRVAPQGKALETAMEMAGRMAAYPTSLLRAIKKGVLETRAMSSPEAIETSIGLYEKLILAGQENLR